jgi:glycerophosphoryl diester phosphodiesterase
MRDWLTGRPIAHRGLHDAASGVIENTPSAFRAAIDGNYGIECDLQISADGEAMVHHDDALGRLTEGAGRLDAMTTEALRRVAFKETADRMLTLGGLCDLARGRTLLLIELKGSFAGDTRLAARTAQVLDGYSGPVAAMSFDPGLMAALRRLAPKLALGLVGMRRDVGTPATVDTSAWRYARRALAVRPQFLAYRVQDLTTAPPLIARHVMRWPLLTWTVRTPQDRLQAAQHADQIIFEGFRPSAPEGDSSAAAVENG